MRAFIAFDINDDARAELARLQSTLKKSEADAKWVSPENIHLTVKFLGEIDEGQKKSIADSLDTITAAHKSVEIALSEIGAFPGIGRPKVLWAGIKGGVDEIIDIARSVDQECSKLGFQAEDRTFTPHLTIGRTRSSKNREKLKQALSASSLKPIVSRVDAIHLYKSTLTPNGPVYEKVHEARFG